MSASSPSHTLGVASAEEHHAAAAQPEEGTGVTFHTNNFTAMSRRAIALLTAAVTLSSIALIGVPAATADEQQATAEQNTATKSSVIINEVYAGNTKNAGDPDSKRCDWVELKNCTYFDIADGAR